MNRGFAPVLIAIGIVSILATMSLVSSMTASIQNSKQIKRLNRVEGFYTGEIAAWHFVLRTKEGLEGVTSSGGALQIDNRYVENIDWLTPDSYDTTPGAPMNVATTKDFAPTKNLIRRYSDTAVRYLASEKNSNSFCGTTQFGKKNVGICLAGSISNPKPVQSWIKATAEMACANLPNKGVQCWGNNASGYSNTTNPMGEYFPSPVWMPDLKFSNSDTSPILSLEPSIATMGMSALTMQTTGKLISWGTITIGMKPFVLDVLTDAIQNTGGGLNSGDGGMNTAAQPFPHILRSNGTIQFLGRNSLWPFSPTQCPGPTWGDTYCWRDIPGISNAILISTGVSHGCAILDGGSVKCWGRYTNLGRGASLTGNRAINSDCSIGPTDVPELSEGVTQIAAGMFTTCALKRGDVWCWRDGGLPQIINLPANVSFIATHLSGHQTCAVAEGSLYCWNSDTMSSGDPYSPFYGTLNKAIKINTPNLPQQIESVAIGGRWSAPGINRDFEAVLFTCVSTTSKEVWCWGAGTKGQLGNGQLSDSPVAVKVNPWAE